MEVKASLNHLRIAPRKMRLIAAAVRGMDADRALAVLGVLRQRASAPVAKLLRSALSDGAHNFEAGGLRFYVKEIRVDSGPATKRFRARAFGRAAAIRKRTSHISLVLGSRSAGDSPVSSGVAHKPKPGAREIASSGVRSESPRAPRERNALADMPKPKAPGAIRRIFQRKVI